MSDLGGDVRLVRIRLATNPHVYDAHGDIAGRACAIVIVIGVMGAICDCRRRRRRRGLHERNDDQIAEHRAEQVGARLLQLNASQANDRVRIASQMVHARRRGRRDAGRCCRWRRVSGGRTLAFVNDELALEVSEKLRTLLLLVHFDYLDVLEALLVHEGEREPAGIVRLASLPEKHLALELIAAAAVV